MTTNAPTQAEARVMELLESPAFRLFLDEDLRRFAYEFVEECLDATERKIKNSQLHAIPGAVQAGGLGELRTLAKNQADKNTKQENSMFWRRVEKVLSQEGTDSGRSIYAFLADQLRRMGMDLPDHDKIADKKERNAQKRLNRELCDRLLVEALPVFCEHFTCQYLYRTGGKANEA